ncbi:hypothetical protein HYU20_01905, partial [Candidatus Woesearchaeota archaeon]|nr:hypothetical protein [Candidatus Woesearchaeota archaeon]
PSVDPTGRTFNPSLSCVGHCTGYAESGSDWCFCDAVCEQNGNCCADFKTACRLPLPSETNPTPLAQEQVLLPDPAGLLRQYPDFIKCSWVSPPGLPQVVENLNELKQLGLNSVCIMQGVRKFDLSTTDERWESMKLTTLSSIATLKRAGFAIVIFLDAGGGPQAEKEYTKLTLQQFLDVVEEEALAWAKLAEEYQVEYFAPANELPSKLHNLLVGYSESERQRKKIEKTNEWHEYMLPKVREVFNGKVIAKLGDYSAGLDPQGYDIVAYTIGHNFITNLEQFRQQKVKATYDVSVTQAANIEWWVGELYFAYEEVGPDAPLEYTTQSRQLRELQDDYHRIIIEEINALPPEKRPKGLVVGGYGPGSLHPALTEESKGVINNFFMR